MLNEREPISALVDDELDDSEVRAVLDRLCEPESLGSWERYHLIQDVLHNNRPSGASLELAERVRRAISDEPTLRLKPIRIVRLPAVFWRQAAGVAVAASVTAAAILGYQHFASADKEPGQTRVAASPQVPTSPPPLDVYLVNHNEYARTSGMQGVLPYVRMVGER